MFVASEKDKNGLNKAIIQAQANASFSRVPWVVFTDTCGNYCVAPHSDTFSGATLFVARPPSVPPPVPKPSEITLSAPLADPVLEALEQSVLRAIVRAISDGATAEAVTAVIDGINGPIGGVAATEESGEIHVTVKGRGQLCADAELRDGVVRIRVDCRKDPELWSQISGLDAAGLRKRIGIPSFGPRLEPELVALARKSGLTEETIAAIPGNDVLASAIWSQVSTGQVKPQRKWIVYADDRCILDEVFYDQDCDMNFVLHQELNRYGPGIMVVLED